MTGKLIIEGTTIKEFVEELTENIRKEKATPETMGRILCEAVPDLTKSQAARMLGGSKGFVDELVKTGYLQEEPGKVEKYSMNQVLQCLFKGKTGRRDSFNLQNLMEQ